MARMRSLAALAFGLFLVAALAGCTGSPQPGTEPVTPTNTTAGGSGGGNATMPNGTGAGNDTGPMVKNYTGSATGVIVPGVVAFSPKPDNGGNFDVKAGATGVVVEVKWNGSDQAQLFVTNGCNNAAGNNGLPSIPPSSSNCPPDPKPSDVAGSPLKVVVTDAKILNATGTWQFTLYPSQNVQGMPWEAWVSVFYGAPPPPNYSAMPK